MDAEELGKNVGLCIRSYKQIYERFPDAVIVTDGTMRFLQENSMLRNAGKENLPYSGMAVATSYGDIGLYWMSRFEGKVELRDGRDRDGKSYHKAGGVCPFILATKKWFPGLRGLKGIKRFKDELDCDIGVPFGQLEKMFARKAEEIKKIKY